MVLPTSPVKFEKTASQAAAGTPGGCNWLSAELQSIAEVGSATPRLNRTEPAAVAMKFTVIESANPSYVGTRRSPTGCSESAPGRTPGCRLLRALKLCS